MRYLLVLLCCAEILLATYLMNVAGPFWSPVLFLSTSLAIAFVYLRVRSKSATTTTPFSLPPIVISAGQAAVFAGSAFYIISKLKYIWWYHLMYQYPPGQSDIIPQIETLVHRFLTGEAPYNPIQFVGYKLYPTYLPMQWLPYIPCELAHKDYRWIPNLTMLAASVYYFISKRKIEGDPVSRIFLPSWPLFIWVMLLLNDNDSVVFTVEGLIAGYYFFVAESTGKKSIWPLAIGISLCLFSRYSIIFWVPLCIAILAMAGQKKNAMIIAGTAAAFFLFVYWLPFVRVDPEIFLKGYRYHTFAAYGEWQRDAIINGKNYLNNGLGFTSYAIAWFPGDLHSKLAIYKNLLFAVCLLAVCLLGLVFYRSRSKYDVNTYLLFSFKIYIAVFYAFIQIPYRYLFFTPLIITAALLGGAFMPRVKDNTNLI